MDCGICGKRIELFGTASMLIQIDAYNHAQFYHTLCYKEKIKGK